jgi:transcriptional regulator with XRE-family HTH domain
MEAKDVGTRIKELREQKKMTQYALANQSGVSPTYIYQLERGEKSPTVEYLEHICWGLGVTLGEFFAEREEKADEISRLTEEQRRNLNVFLKSL